MLYEATVQYQSIIHETRHNDKSNPLIILWVTKCGNSQENISLLYGAKIKRIYAAYWTLKDRCLQWSLFHYEARSIRPVLRVSPTSFGGAT